MNKISSKHFVLFMIGASIISAKTYLSIFIDIGGRDTWLSALIASILFILFLNYIIHIFKISKSFDITEIFKSSLPKIIYIFYIIFFIITLFLNALESASVEANIIHSTLFINTPIWYCLIFFLLPSLFIFNKKIRTLLIFILVSVFTLIINGILILILTQSYKDINNLLPVLGNGFSSGFITSIFLILGSFSTVMLAIPFLKYIDNYSKLRKHSLFASFIIIAFIVTSFVSVITAFGPLRSANIFYPEFILCQRIKISGFLEFGEIFFITQSVVGFLVKYILSSYAIIILCDRFIKKRKIFIGIYTFIIFVFSNFLALNNYFLQDALKYLQIINLIIFLIIPLLLFIIYHIKFKIKKKV